METNQTRDKTESQLHNELVVAHLNELESIKAEIIKKEYYEAADVITKSISLIKSTHISNDYLANENRAMKANLRMHLAGLAMSALIGVNIDQCTKSIAEKAYQIADEMLLIAKK